MNSTKIMVNGALMDKNFFEENIQEAKACSWEEKSMTIIANHGHCIVCAIALPNKKSDRFFASGSLLLCDHCYKNYL